MANDIRAGVYEIVNPTNGGRYIGSSMKIKYRLNKHRAMLERGNHHSRILQSAWNKHGADAFDFKPIIICCERDLVMYEQTAMDFYRPRYNVLPRAGSALGRLLSEDHKKKIGDANRGNVPIMTEERRRNLSAALKGRPHGPMSAETKAKVSANRKGKYTGHRRPEIGLKISIALTGRKLSLEHVAKMAALHRGVKQTPEHIAKSVAARLGKKRGRYKKRHSPEECARKSEQMRGNLYCLGHRHSPEARANMAAAQKRRRSLEANNRGK